MYQVLINVPCAMLVLGGHKNNNKKKKLNSVFMIEEETPKTRN